jgi:hypothetical protein
LQVVDDSANTVDLRRIGGCRHPSRIVVTETGECDHPIAGLHGEVAAVHLVIS